jgi:Peptidase family M41
MHTEANKATVACYEVGHATIMPLLPGCGPAQRVSTLSRGMPLRLTVFTPAEDRVLLSRSNWWLSWRVSWVAAPPRKSSSETSPPEMFSSPHGRQSLAADEAAHQMMRGSPAA